MIDSSVGEYGSVRAVAAINLWLSPALKPDKPITEH